MCNAWEFFLISDFTILRHHDYKLMGFLKAKHFKAHRFIHADYQLLRYPLN